MIASLCLFLMGGGAGAFLAARHFLRRGLPGSIAILHGVLGAGGFALLLLFCTREPTFVPARYSLAILAVAIGLGCVNVVYHLRRLRHRTFFIVAHALAALTGVASVTFGAVVHARAPLALAANGAPRAPASAATLPPDPPPKAEGSGRAAFAWGELEVHFDAKSVAPAGESLAQIASVAAELQADADVRLVEVQGHADERGDEAYNLELTRARAENVIDALVRHGVARSRLRGVGYGARCAADAECRRADAPKWCHEEASWRRARRVTFFVLESSTERGSGPVACPRPSESLAAADAPYAAGSTRGK